MNDDSLADAINGQSPAASNGARIDQLESRAHAVDSATLDNFHDNQKLRTAVVELAFRVRVLTIGVVITAPLALIGAGLAIWEAVTS